MTDPKEVKCPHCGNDTFYANSEEKIKIFDIKISIPILTCTRCVKQVDNS